MTGWILVGVLTAIFAIVGLRCMAEYSRRRERKHEKATYLPSFMLWVGVVCGGVFLVIAWFAAADKETGLLVLCFGAFALLGIVLMLGWKNCYITYDHKGFTQYNILGMQRSFTYDQLTGYRRADGAGTDIKLYACGKTITVDMLAKNGFEFLMEARKGYARCNNGTMLPNTWESQRKIQKQTGKGSFSAHVHNPGEFLAVFIMLMAFVLGVSIFCFVAMWKPIEMADCQQQNLTFYFWKVEEDTLVLRADGFDEPFKIGDYADYMSGFAELTQKCDGKTQFTAWTEYHEPDDAAPCYVIRELSADGVTYRTFADSTNAKRAGFWPVLCILAGVNAVVLLMSWMTYRIGCNPRKYPKWLVRGFFKDGSISY